MQRNPDGRCTGCDAGYDTLGDHVEQIEHRLAQRRRTLDAKRPRVSITVEDVKVKRVAGTSEVRVLRSAEEVHALTEHLIQLVAVAPGVTVAIERAES